jgi:hypothetical protein
MKTPALYLCRKKSYTQNTLPAKNQFSLHFPAEMIYNTKLRVARGRFVEPSFYCNEKNRQQTFIYSVMLETLVNVNRLNIN